VPNDENDNSNSIKVISSVTTTAITQEPLVVEEGKKHEEDYSHRGKISHSKNTDELENENIKADLKIKITEDYKNYNEEQQILLNENKQNIIDFIIDNKDSIKIEDLKIYEPIYKCYREKGKCRICNKMSNIICINCITYNYNKEVWLCTDHWKQYIIEKHE
jgi:hypothetical protein